MREREPSVQRLDRLPDQRKVDNCRDRGAQEAEKHDTDEITAKCAKYIKHECRRVEIGPGPLSHQQLEGPHIVAEEAPQEDTGQDRKRDDQNGGCQQEKAKTCPVEAEGAIQQVADS